MQSRYACKYYLCGYAICANGPLYMPCEMRLRILIDTQSGLALWFAPGRDLLT